MADIVVLARGSLRSRGATAVSAYTLRPVTGLIPPERAWGLWLSRQLVARIMDTFGPSLAGTRVEQVDTRLPDGRRLEGEWVCGPRTPTGATPYLETSSGEIYYVHGSGYAGCSPRTHRPIVQRHIADSRTAGSDADVVDDQRGCRAGHHRGRATAGFRPAAQAVQCTDHGQPASSARAHAAAYNAHDRGELYCMPQLDARIGWNIKRIAPQTYTRAAGLLSRANIH